MKYKKKPVVIEAIQVDNNKEEVRKFVGNKGYPQYYDGETLSFVIRTLEGDMTANPGDWIIKGIKGEFYSCKPDIFEETYEAVK